MSKKLTVSVADDVYYDIEANKGKNRSEFTESMIRKGLAFFHAAQKKGDDETNAKSSNDGNTEAQ